ncbi:hypothetical protein EFL99_03635 [Lactococcus lactis]|uniref:hypothetical protein n=1 Tax=Lactococcus lactis TaxID=1358 RepID=UPI00223AA4C2|nr:hypothetical protein [Lactococcus lactis]MCT1182379.1 hypothetical protein [Lactococcus lactis]
MKKFIPLSLVTISLVLLTACNNESSQGKNSASNSAYRSEQSSSTAESSSKQGPDLSQDIGAYSDGEWTQLTLQQQEQVFMKSYKKFAPNFDGSKLVPTLQTFDISISDSTSLSDWLSSSGLINNNGNLAIFSGAGGNEAMNGDSSDSLIEGYQKASTYNIENSAPAGISYGSFLSQMRNIVSNLALDSTAYVKMLQNYVDSKNIQALKNIDYLMSAAAPSSTSNATDSNSSSKTPYSQYSRKIYAPSQGETGNLLESLIDEVSQGKGGDVSKYIAFQTNTQTSFTNVSSRVFTGANAQTYGDDCYTASLVLNQTNEKDSSDINSTNKTYSFSTFIGNGEYWFKPHGAGGTGTSGGVPNPLDFPGISPFSAIIYSKSDNMIFFILGNQ